MLPTVFVPKHEIVTFDDSVFLIDSEKIESFLKEIEKSKFVKIWKMILATSTIKMVRPAKKEISILERLLVGKPEEIKNKVREKVKAREKERLETTEWVVSNIISHYETDW